MDNKIVGKITAQVGDEILELKGRELRILLVQRAPGDPAFTLEGEALADDDEEFVRPLCELVDGEDKEGCLGKIACKVIDLELHVTIGKSK